MGPPTRDDPLGLKPNPRDFGDMLNMTVDARIEQRLTGRTKPEFNNVPDMELVRELLARGWAVFRPNSNN